MSRKSDVWRKHMEAQENSGLSQAEYCRRHQLDEKRLYYWRSRLKRAGSVSSSNFVEVGTKSEQFAVVLGNGVKVTVPVGFDGESLKRLVELLSC